MTIRLINMTDTHMLGIIETGKGNEYACYFAKEKDENGQLTYPTQTHVKEAWKENKRDFHPYQHFCSTH